MLSETNGPTDRGDYIGPLRINRGPKIDKKLFLSPTPVSPSSSDDVHLHEVYPSPSHDNIKRDGGDPRHGKSYVSQSYDEGTQCHKKEIKLFGSNNTSNCPLQSF